MRTQALLASFGAIADAPDGIQRLRQLALMLAVRGRLVSQDLGDEPAFELLERISRDGLVSTSPLTRPVADSDAPWSLPPTWRWARFKDVADFSAGKTPPTKDPSYWADSSGYSWVTISDMPEGGEVTGTRRRVSQKAAEQVFRSGPTPAGTLLMSFKLTIGKVARLAAPGYHNEAIIAVYPPYVSLGEFLFRVLPLLAPGGDRRAAIKGSTLNRTSLTNLLIPVPPLAEQDRIVRMLDEVKALSDDLEWRAHHRRLIRSRFGDSALHALTEAVGADARKAWDRVSMNWEALTEASDGVGAIRKTIFQLAVQGRLVPQDEADEAAEVAVARAIAAKSTAVAGRRKQPPLEDLSSAAAPLPPGWVWTRVDDVFLVTGGIQKLPARRPVRNHFPYLRVANVQRGWLDLSEIERFELRDGELELFRLVPGDLLVVEGNGSESEIGRCARWDGAIADCVHQNHIIRCRPMLRDIERFLLLYLNSPEGTQTMRSLAVTTSGLYNLSVAKIRSIRFPMPPLAEQGRIRRTIEELMQVSETLEARLAEKRDVHRRLAVSASAIAGP
jgi:type I restriction enzyme S subunit